MNLRERTLDALCELIKQIRLFIDHDGLTEKEAIERAASEFTAELRVQGHWTDEDGEDMWNRDYIEEYVSELWTDACRERMQQLVDQEYDGTYYVSYNGYPKVYLFNNEETFENNEEAFDSWFLTETEYAELSKIVYVDDQ